MIRQSALEIFGRVKDVTCCVGLPVLQTHTHTHLCTQ